MFNLLIINILHAKNRSFDWFVAHFWRDRYYNVQC